MIIQTCAQWIDLRSSAPGEFCSGDVVQVTRSFCSLQLQCRCLFLLYLGSTRSRLFGCFPAPSKLLPKPNQATNDGGYIKETIAAQQCAPTYLKDKISFFLLKSLSEDIMLCSQLPHRLLCSTSPPCPPYPCVAPYNRISPLHIKQYMPLSLR